MYPNELFNIFGISIDLYAICFIVGIVACLVFTVIAMKKTGFSSTASDAIIVIGILSIMIGLISAVLFQGFYNLIAGRGFTFGGMTFIGGLIGGVGAFVGLYFLYVYVINPRLKDQSFLKSNMNKGIWYLLRIAPISITIAHGFGRLGCMFAGCCHGHVTEEWFGIWNASLNAKTVPIQLYEAIFLFVVSVIMIVLLFKFDFKYNMTVYLMGYGLWRFIIEYFRADYRGDFIPGLSPSQFWSIIMFIGGIIFFFLYRHFDPRLKKEIVVKDEEEKETEKSAE